MHIRPPKFDSHDWSGAFKRWLYIVAVLLFKIIFYAYIIILHNSITTKQKSKSKGKFNSCWCDKITANIYNIDLGIYIYILIASKIAGKNRKKIIHQLRRSIFECSSFCMSIARSKYTKMCILFVHYYWV